MNVMSDAQDGLILVQVQVQDQVQVQVQVQVSFPIMKERSSTDGSMVKARKRGVQTLMKARCF